jgi:hypothetical protein
MGYFKYLYYRFYRGPHAKLVALSIFGILAILAFQIIGLLCTSLWEFCLAVSLVGITLFLSVVIIIQNLTRAKVNDIHYAISLSSALKDAGYEMEQFYTDGAAASPSLQLFNLKVLQFCRPKRILELGSGQTTKILSCYANGSPGSYVLTLEQNELWYKLVREKVGHDYRFAPLTKTSFVCQGSHLSLDSLWYEEQEEIAKGGFDYVLVDGPDPGTAGVAFVGNSRCGVLKYLPSILSSSFVIVFDDAERYGEIMTINNLEDILIATKIPYIRFSIHGIKTQVVFCSPDKSFLRSV